MTEKLKMIVVPGAHLAGDGVEDIAIVKVPALVAQLVGTALHQADHVVPDNHQLRAQSQTRKAPDGCELVRICVLHLEGGEVGGGEVPEPCLDRACVEHVAGAGVASLPWHPGKNFLP